MNEYFGKYKKTRRSQIRKKIMTMINEEQTQHHENVHNLSNNNNGLESVHHSINDFVGLDIQVHSNESSNTSEKVEPVEGSTSSTVFHSIHIHNENSFEAEELPLNDKNYSSSTKQQSENLNCINMLNLLSSFEVTPQLIQSLEALIALLKIQLESQTTEHKPKQKQKQTQTQTQAQTQTQEQEQEQESIIAEENLPYWKIGGPGKVKLVNNFNCWISSTLLDVIRFDLFDNPNEMTRQLITALIGKENIGKYTVLGRRNTTGLPAEVRGAVKSFVLNNSCLKDDSNQDEISSGDDSEDNEKSNRKKRRTLGKSLKTSRKKTRKVKKFSFNRVVNLMRSNHKKKNMMKSSETQLNEKNIDTTINGSNQDNSVSMSQDPLFGASNSETLGQNEQSFHQSYSNDMMEPITLISETKHGHNTRAMNDTSYDANTMNII